jgi:hypothetical protein
MFRPVKVPLPGTILVLTIHRRSAVIMLSAASRIFSVQPHAGLTEDIRPVLASASPTSSQVIERQVS